MASHSGPGVRPVRRVLAAAEHGLSGMCSVIANGARWRWRRGTRWLRLATRRWLLRSSGGVLVRLPAGVLRKVLPVIPSRLLRELTVTVLEPVRREAAVRAEVSVVMVARDQSELLGLALRALQNQVDVAWECIVVDDSSTDDSALVAQQFVDRDQRFSLLVNDRPVGAEASIRSGSDATVGKLVVPMRPDLVLVPGALRRLRAALDLCPPGSAGVAGRVDLALLDTDMELIAALRSSRARTTPVVTDDLILARVPGGGVGEVEPVIPLPSSQPSVALRRRVESVTGEQPAAWSLATGDRSGVEVRTRRRGGFPVAIDAGTIDPTTVVLVGESQYHIDELGPLAEELRWRGRKVEFMHVPAVTRETIAEIASYSDHMIEFSPGRIGHAGALVVMNDWGHGRALVDAANDAGVPTFGKVEGAQDFDDVDTGRDRSPYRRVGTVLGQGRNDLEALAGCDVVVVGSSRLERIWLGPPVASNDVVLVNLNFTFRVLTEERNAWIRSVAAAIERAGANGVISRHPADNAPIPRSVLDVLTIADKPFRNLITRAGVLVSRFSTAPFEAMAHGVPFVYHRPPGEHVDTFASPDGAFEVTQTTETLATAVGRALERTGAESRIRSAEFFTRQVDVRPGVTAAHRAAEAIEARLAPLPSDRSAYPASRRG